MQTLTSRSESLLENTTSTTMRTLHGVMLVMQDAIVHTMVNLLCTTTERNSSLFRTSSKVLEWTNKESGFHWPTLVVAKHQMQTAASGRGRIPLNRLFIRQITGTKVIQRTLSNGSTERCHQAQVNGGTSGEDGLHLRQLHIFPSSASFKIRARMQAPAPTAGVFPAQQLASDVSRLTKTNAVQIRVATEDAASPRNRSDIHALVSLDSLVKTASLSSIFALRMMIRVEKEERAKRSEVMTTVVNVVLTTLDLDVKPSTTTTIARPIPVTTAVRVRTLDAIINVHVRLDSQERNARV